MLVERHRDPGHVPHSPRLAVPGGARVEPVPVLNTSITGQTPDGVLDGVQTKVCEIIPVHYDALGPVAQEPRGGKCIQVSPEQCSPL